MAFEERLVATVVISLLLSSCERPPQPTDPISANQPVPSSEIKKIRPAPEPEPVEASASPLVTDSGEPKSQAQIQTPPAAAPSQAARKKGTKAASKVADRPPQAIGRTRSDLEPLESRATADAPAEASASAPVREPQTSQAFTRDAAPRSSAERDSAAPVRRQPSNRPAVRDEPARAPNADG